MFRPKREGLNQAALRRRFFLPLIALASLAINASSYERHASFERTYTPRGPAHLTISNINGSIRVKAWNKKTIHVRAKGPSSRSIEDHTFRNEISITVRRALRLDRVDFDVSVPAETSLSLKNVIGKIEIEGVHGHLTVNSFDSDVRLVGIQSPSVDVKVTSGNVYFDGELQSGGIYSLQSMRGDIDVTIPSASSFSLNARAMSENINLGGFLPNMGGITRWAKGITGTYHQGGPRLTLTTYAGRILLHKK
ncbi:MAG TPA: DUF4097 family beta strand repeat-containing protein [Blastocatellia bacterium]|nr:DUF4097 family beta strand repeat-containing protein [Blastocatellia bacterium]